MPTLPDDLRIATNYLRKAILFIPTRGVVDKNRSLHLHILKRYKPKRVYGPLPQHLTLNPSII